MSSDKNRLENEPAFILHGYPFRETSLLLEVFSRNHGRIPMVARGARRPRSSMRGLLMGFQPVNLSWFGKGEVRTLHGVEWQGGQPQLQGKALLCGLYLNELLINLMARDDAHEKLFDYYRQTLHRLALATNYSTTLRNFEKHLLQELGYALLLECEAESGKPIQPESQYCYVIERGVFPYRPGIQEGIQVSGRTLLDIAADDYSNSDSVNQSKKLMRMLLNHYLAGKILHTRELIQELQNLGN